MIEKITIQLAAEIFSIAVGVFSYYKKSLSLSGLLALLLITSTLIAFYQIGFLVLMFAMFASSTLLTRYKKSQKTAFEKVVSKTGPRDAFQAFANLGVPFFCAVLYYFFRYDCLIAALAGSIAAANADSWASEIGGLSKKLPVNIIGFKPMQKGISGGITLTGTIAGIAGAGFIVLLYVMMFSASENINQVIAISSLSAGISGFLADSVLGSLFQALYSKDNEYFESNVKDSLLIKGFPWINNDLVNFLSSLFAGVFALKIYFFIQLVILFN